VLDLRNLQENLYVSADATKRKKIKQSRLPIYKAALAHRQHDTDREIKIKFLSGYFQQVYAG